MFNDFGVINIDREVERQRDLEHCGPFEEPRDYDDEPKETREDFEEIMSLIENDIKAREEEKKAIKSINDMPF